MICIPSNIFKLFPDLLSLSDLFGHCPGTIHTKTPIRSAKKGATKVPKAQPDDENR